MTQGTENGTVHVAGLAVCSDAESWNATEWAVRPDISGLQPQRLGHP